MRNLGSIQAVNYERALIRGIGGLAKTSKIVYIIEYILYVT